MEESTKRDPLEFFKAYRERRQIESELQNYKWTFEETEKLKAQDPLGYNALYSFIKDSHARGDYLCPWELPRKEAKEYLEARGIQGEPWSTAEIRALRNDPELWKDYGDEAKRAQTEGRIIKGPDIAKGEIYHFGGESFVEGSAEHETFKRNLNAKLERIDKQRIGHKMIDESLQKLSTLIDQKISGTPIQVFLFNALKDIEKNTTETYPIEAHPGYSKLKQALEVVEDAIDKDVEDFSGRLKGLLD